jgi:hypothetical protein
MGNSLSGVPGQDPDVAAFDVLVKRCASMMDSCDSELIAYSDSVNRHGAKSAECALVAEQVLGQFGAQTCQPNLANCQARFLVVFDERGARLRLETSVQ